MTLNLFLKDAKLMKNVIDALTAIVDEANLIASSNGLEARALDTSRAAMVDLRLPENTFETYEFNGEEAIVIGIKLKELMDILKLANPDESLRMWLDEDEAKLKLELKGASGVRMFGLSLLDLGGDSGKRPNLSLDFSILLSSTLFQNAVKTSETGGDQVTLHANDKELVFSSTTSTRDVRFEIPKDSPDVLEFSWLVDSHEAKANYAMKYLHEFTRGTKLSEAVKLEFGNDKPIRLTFEVPGGGYISYIAAPRVEWED